jgi:hypothetical protein
LCLSQHAHDREHVKATVGLDEASQCIVVSLGTRSGSGRNHLAEPCDKCQQHGGFHVEESFRTRNVEDLEAYYLLEREIDRLDVDQIPETGIV